MPSPLFFKRRIEMTVKHYGNKVTGQGDKGLPFSKAVRAGDFVFVSGQVAMDEKGVVVFGDIESQTRVTMDNVIKTLALADCELKDVIKATIWLDDVRDFWGFNKVYSEYFPENPPARATVRSELMVDAKIEIEVMAYKPE
jgi:reactive intermediate/imine deaminase